MRSTLSIDIDAPARLVFELARDVRRWPDLLPHYLAVIEEEREAEPGVAQPRGAMIARMSAVRAVVPLLGYGIPVTWRARTWAEEEPLRLRFVHRGGATDGMDVTWRIEPSSTGCTVSIDHDFEPAIPAWATFVTAAFVKPIATRTLATFKAIAEAADTASRSGADGASRSAVAGTTKTSA